jgi:hypothetical protein
MERLVQTMHLSCTDTSTISKRTETIFHKAHVTKELHWVRLKWFLSLWNVQRKPCTCLASRLELSPNGLNRASTWASSPKSITGCVQNNFWAYGMICANRAHILHRHYHYLQIDQNEIPHNPRLLGVLSSVSRMISKPIVRSTDIVHLSCVMISNISKQIESSFHLSLVT